MEMAALCLLLFLVMNSLDSGRARVSISVTPGSSQLFKYDSFSVSCEGEEEGEEQEKQGQEWTGPRVMKRMMDGEVHECPSHCSISVAFPFTDSGVYWCETGPGRTSDRVNITVTAGPVILESPALPVVEGDRVTLHCRGHKASAAATTATTADFFKDRQLITTSPTRNMTIDSISMSDQGLYRCSLAGYGGSPESWLVVTAPTLAPPLALSTLLRHLMVGAPYLLSTILLGLLCRDKKRVLQANEAQRPSDDVIIQKAI